MSDSSSASSMTSREDGTSPSQSSNSPGAVMGFRSMSCLELSISPSRGVQVRPHRRQKSLLTQQLQSPTASSPALSLMLSTPFKDSDTASISDNCSSGVSSCSADGADYALAFLRSQLRPLNLTKAARGTAPLPIPDTTELREKLHNQAQERLKAAVNAEDFQRARLYLLEQQQQRARQAHPQSRP